MKLADALSDVSLLCFDTAPIIYFIERNPNYIALVHEIIARLSRGDITAMTSVITLTEVLALPRRIGNATAEAAYINFLAHGRNLSLVPINNIIADRAAALRAAYNLRTPDALQIAAAQFSGADAFLTNDSGLRRVKEIRIIILSDLEL